MVGYLLLVNSISCLKFIFFCLDTKETKNQACNNSIWKCYSMIFFAAKSCLLMECGNSFKIKLLIALISPTQSYRTKSYFDFLNLIVEGNWMALIIFSFFFIKEKENNRLFSNQLVMKIHQLQFVIQFKTMCEGINANALCSFYMQLVAQIF